MRRREFLASGAIAAGAGLGALFEGAGAAETARANAPTLAAKLPRWRGFNLMEKIGAESIMRVHGGPLPGNQPFREQDFEWIAELGFDFVRLPMDYHCWTRDDDPYALDEKTLKEIDQAVGWGRQYGIHVCLNMHHAPGYRVGRTITPNLWVDEEPQKQFSFQWSMFARRYRGVPSNRLSFNLVNEPGRITQKAAVTEEIAAKVYRQAIAAIRREDPDRLIILDGLTWAKVPLPSLAGLHVAQSTHWYQPRELTHNGAAWIPAAKQHGWPAPAWPLRYKERLFDRRWLRDTYLKPWTRLQAKGVGVHVGEWGILDTVPHDVALAWMRDCLELWKEAGWGWALWNFRGEHGFGFLDTHRKDVRYEDFHGHRLDRKMLELLRKVCTF